MPKDKPEKPSVRPSDTAVDQEKPSCTSACTLTSQTEATYPPDRARTRIGVGEYVTITVEPGPASWVLKRGGGKLSDATATTITFTAPDRAQEVEIVAEVRGCRCSITFEIIEPSGVLMRIKEGSKKKHVRGTASTGMITEIWIQPADVSFENANFREHEVRAVGTGCFETHLAENWTGHGASETVWTAAGVDGDGTKLSGIDKIHFHGTKCDGTMTWPIPWVFALPGGKPKVFAVVEQVGTFDDRGRVTITKAGASVSSKLSDPTEEDPEFR